MADENSPQQFDFDAYFRNILLKAYDRDLRILKLENPIPEVYEKDLKSFSQKFFSENPFEITNEDLEEFYIEGKLFKRIRIDRRPSTYLSLFRLTELYRAELEKIRGDIADLAKVFKEDKPSIDKDLVLKETLSAGRVYQKLSVLAQNFHTALIRNVNHSLKEIKIAMGSDGFLNLRKVNGDAFISSILNPHYNGMLNNSLFLIAISKKINQHKLAIEENIKK
jgi:hypothetical protein